MGEKRGLKALQAWCRKVTEGYKNVSVTDMSMSWRDGLAFCAIIHHFRPDLVDFDSLTKDDILLNNRLAFTVAEQSLGIPALLDAEDMVRYSEPDKLSIATYVSQYYQFFEGRNRGTASNNLHTNKLSMKRPFADRTFAPQALPAKIPGVAPRGFFKDDKCSVCSNRVFILERLMVGAKLYHRTCFVCYKCETVLRPGAYAASDDEGKFECIECPRDEKESSPVTEDVSIEQSVEIELSSPATTKETDKSANIDSESVGNSLKLSNSFISARKKFFETSLEEKSNEKAKEQEEESMKLSIDEGLIMKNVSSKEEIQIEPQSSIESKPEEAKAIILKEEDKLDVKETHTDDLTTPVNPISFDFNVKEVRDDIESSKEPPELPTSNLPTEVEDSKTPTNIAPISTTLPPPKTPRKTKRLSIDLSSLPTNTEPQTSALNSPTRSMSPTTSLPLITPVTGISSLKRESSINSLRSISKPGKLVLTPTELTSPERDRKSLDLKGSYQSPLSPGSKWKSSLYDKHEETKDSNRSSLTTEKPKIPDKPLTLTKLPTVPTNEKDAILTKMIDVESKPDSLPKDNQLKGPESSDPFEEEPESPKKEVQIEVKVKPARPPRPVIKETPMIEKKPQSKLKVEEYPDDLNPFGDDEEESKEEYPDDLNPFGDEDEPESEPVSTQDKSTDKTSLKSNSTHSLSKIENYDSKLNPFGDSDDEESNLDTLSFSKDSHLSADFSHSSLPSTPRSSSRSSRTMGGRKKKPAPLPPSLLVSGRENHQSDLNICYKSSHSPSRSSLQGSLRGSPNARKKAAPRPPIPPPALASTPKKDVDAVSQDLKAQKEQNNKTMKELAINSPDKNEANTFGYWKKKKRPAPSVPVPPRRQIKMIPVKEIQSELLEIEEKQEDLETQGRDLEMMIREYNQGDESDSPVTVDEEELILQLFELVNQKNILFRRQAELMYIKRSQSLEQEQADIEYKYRIVSSKPEKLKSEADIKKEENLLQRLIEIVELRNEIVESMDMDRQRVQDEDTSIQEQMAQRQGQLQEKLSPDASVSELVEDAEVKKEKKKHKLKFIKRDKSKDPKEKKPKEPKEKESKVKDPKAKDDSLWKFAKKDKKKATT